MTMTVKDFEQTLTTAEKYHRKVVEFIEENYPPKHRYLGIVSFEGLKVMSTKYYQDAIELSEIKNDPKYLLDDYVSTIVAVFDVMDGKFVYTDDGRIGEFRFFSPEEVTSALMDKKKQLQKKLESLSGKEVDPSLADIVGSDSAREIIKKSDEAVREDVGTTIQLESQRILYRELERRYSIYVEYCAAENIIPITFGEWSGHEIKRFEVICTPSALVKGPPRTYHVRPTEHQ